MITKEEIISWLEPVKINRQTRVRLMVVWLICLGLVLVLVAVILIPSIRAYLANRGKIKALNAKLSRYQKKYNQLASIDPVSLDNKIKTGTKILPLYHNAPLLLAVLSGLSQEHQVKLSSLNFTPGEVASESVNLVVKPTKTTKNTKLPTTLPLRSMKLKFQVTGQLAHIRQFLISLEKIKPITRISKVSLNLETKPDQIQASPSAELAGASPLVSSYVEVEFFAVSLPKKMPGIEDPLYIVPQNLEDAYTKIVQDYRSFTSQPAVSAPTRRLKRLSPFNYPVR